MPGEPQQDSSRVIPEKRTWETNMQFIVGLVAAVGVELLKVLIDELRKRAERKREAKALKVHESCTKEDLQELIQQMKAMFEDLQKLQEPRKTEKGNTPKAQGSRMEETLQQLCQEVKAVREDLQKGQESRKTEEGNTPKAQGSRMEETLQQLCQEMKAVREDLQKGQESAKQDIQLLKADLNKEMDRKIEKMARAQESKMDKEFQRFCQRIQGLEQELHGRLVSQQHNLQLLRAETGMKQERRREAKASKVQGSCTKEDLQELIQQMKTMFEDLQKLQESSVLIESASGDKGTDREA